MVGLNTLTEGARWKEAEMTRLDEERQLAFHERGIPTTEFWKVDPGVHKVILLTDIPREHDGKYGKQRIFQIDVDGNKWSWALQLKSALYRKVVELYSGETEVPIEVVRVGTNKNDTRYDVSKIE